MPKAGLIISSIARHGFGELSKTAFDVQDASKVKEYLTKMGQSYTWTSGQELTKLHSKKSTKRGGLTPFALAYEYQQTKDSLYASLFSRVRKVFSQETTFSLV